MSLRFVHAFVLHITDCCTSAAAYAVNSYLHPASKALRFTRLSPDDVDSSNLPLNLTMDVLVGAGSKRKNGSAQSDGKAPKKPRTKKAAPVALETDNESETDFRRTIRGGTLQDDVDADEDELEAWESALGAGTSSDAALDEDGWASVKTSRKASAEGTGVLELD